MFGDSKCVFVDKCPWYSVDSGVCNVDGGMYYDDGMSGCYNRMEKTHPVKEGFGAGSIIIWIVVVLFLFGLFSAMNGGVLVGPPP